MLGAAGGGILGGVVTHSAAGAIGGAVLGGLTATPLPEATTAIAMPTGTIATTRCTATPLNTPGKV